jgi:hypothetical protein
MYEFRHGGNKVNSMKALTRRSLMVTDELTDITTPLSYFLSETLTATSKFFSTLGDSFQVVTHSCLRRNEGTPVSLSNEI